MKTIVLQSFRTHDVPGWIGACMGSVRAWAEGRGWAYELMDDAFLALAPDWARWRCRGNLYAVTDVSRLIWARRKLDEGYERAVWADADVLVFAPARLRLTDGSGHGVARELFLHVGEGARTTPIHGLNNALMAFERGDPVLDACIEACYRCLRALAPGPVPRTALGPDLLRRLAEGRQLRSIDGLGLFSPAIMEQIACGGGPLTREYLRHSPVPPAAANLCHFMRNATRGDLRPAFDRMYGEAIGRLLESGGAVLGAGA